MPEFLPLPASTGDILPGNNRKNRVVLRVILYTQLCKTFANVCCCVRDPIQMKATFESLDEN